MKKIVKRLQVVLSIVIMASMFISMTTGVAGAQSMKKLSASDATVTKGNSTTVEVKVELNELLEVANLSFTLEYDSNAFNVSNVVLENTIKNKLGLEYNVPSAGRIAVIGGTENKEPENVEFTSPVLIATITFRAKDSVVVGETYPVRFVKANLSTLVDGAIVKIDNLQTKDGSIRVVSAPTGGGGGKGGSTSDPGKYLPGGGTQQPGTEQPGTEQPGTEQPGTEQPGTEEPGTEQPGAPTSADSFSDIPETMDWSKPAIDYLVKKGIIRGTSENTFEPERSITRAEFTKIIVAAFGFEDTEGDVSFTDVSDDDWYSEFVKIAVKNGLVQGYPEGDFRPNATITREEMATILVRAFKALGIDIETGDVDFADSEEIGDWAAEYVAALANLGIVQGRGDNMFVPKDNLTRAEAAVVIYKSIMQFFENQ